ncbi:hypothetical protein HK099_001779 [Clydaea vesicula]|uniref:peptidylprolyl isomerase n=1 Tax=Clydaea vesicula TaxID=447962 RepID=A0AAD5U3G0_9FUNG|nr:hypothetical protein HK099_001779 [Clydaea vesicula]
MHFNQKHDKTLKENLTTNEFISIPGTLDGVKKKIFIEGTKEIKSNSKVTIEYAAFTLPGLKKFDSSASRRSPFTVQLGKDSLIKGLEIAINTMKLGQKAQVFVRSDYGYGEKGLFQQVPPNTDLRFDVEVNLVELPVVPSLDDRLQLIKKEKKAGNINFKNSDFESAIKNYLECFEVSSLSAWGATPDQLQDLNSLRLSICSNLALTYFNLNKFEESLLYCEEVRKIDQWNLKTLFRISRNYSMLHKFDEALSILFVGLEIHSKMMSSYLSLEKLKEIEDQKSKIKYKNDLDILKEHHLFIRDEESEDGSWESRVSKKYYDKLFKEYCVANLALYKEGKIAMRWRVEKEVISGQFICGNVSCIENTKLKTWEVNFGYIENNEKKNALVKLRLCEDCSFKLNYRKIKDGKKALKEIKKNEKKKRKKEVKLEEESDLLENENESKKVKTRENEEKSDTSTDFLNTIQPEENMWLNKNNEKNLEEKTFNEELDDFFNEIFD